LEKIGHGLHVHVRDHDVDQTLILHLDETLICTLDYRVVVRSLFGRSATSLVVRWGRCFPIEIEIDCNMSRVKPVVIVGPSQLCHTRNF
jgi:hypothetical protein